MHLRRLMGDGDEIIFDDIRQATLLGFGVGLRF